MIAIQTDDIDIGALITDAKKPGTGAVVVFDGVVRDDDIRAIELEAYSEVAVPELERIARDATGQFRLLHVDIVHRIGRLAVGENILIIVVAAGHRKEAYAGSRYIIEEIKKGVPIWKKELTKDGERGVPGSMGTAAVPAPPRDNRNDQISFNVPRCFTNRSPFHGSSSTETSTSSIPQTPSDNKLNC